MHGAPHQLASCGLEPVAGTPGLFVLKPWDADAAAATATSTGALPLPFFLDPGARLTKDINGWLRRVRSCYENMDEYYLLGVPGVPLYINGLAKVGGQRFPSGSPMCKGRQDVQQGTAQGTAHVQ